MYGTIFNLNIRPGHEDKLLATMKEESTSKPEGMVAWFVMNPDDKDEWTGVAIFESKEAYMAAQSQGNSATTNVTVKKGIITVPPGTKTKASWPSNPHR